VVKKLYSVAATALLAVGLVVGLGSPASADTQNGNCESQEICLYYSANFSGYLKDFYESLIEDYSYYTFEGTSVHLNDNVVSIKNQQWWTDEDFCWNSYWRGPCFTLNAGYTLSSLWNVNGVNFNNQLSSHID